jgi:hypothetical protein
MKRPRRQFKALAKYGPIGVSALGVTQQATPKETAHRHLLLVLRDRGPAGIFRHPLVELGMFEDPGQIPVAVLIQYGHATGNGGYVQGSGLHQPRHAPIFDQIAIDMWKEVTK